MVTCEVIDDDSIAGLGNRQTATTRKEWLAKDSWVLSYEMSQVRCKADSYPLDVEDFETPAKAVADTPDGFVALRSRYPRSGNKDELLELMLLILDPLAVLVK
jgi:hypothetical protein